MEKPKLIRITTVPLSLEKLLEGQLAFMKGYFEVTAISSERERLVKFGKHEGVATFYLPMTRKITPFHDFNAVWKLYRFLKKEKPKIVHSHTPKAGIIAMLTAYLAKVPHRLHTVAGLPLMESRGLKRIVLNAVEKLTYRFATRIYPNSRGLYDFILAEKFVSGSKLKIIGNGSSNGIDLINFSKENFSEPEIKKNKTMLGISPGDFVFIFVGRIVRDKGINELVTSFAQVQKMQPNCTLLLVGSFEEELDPVSENTKKEISTNPKIVITGYQNDVRIFYAMSNVLVFPSYREGFPNVVMQAGAMELAAIVSNINGCNEIIVENKNGIIIPAKDVKALFDAMILLLKDKQLYKKLQNSARSMITERFDQKEIWQALLNEYKLLQNNL